MRYIDITVLLQKNSTWGNQEDLWKNKTLKEDFKNHFHKKCWYTEVLLVGQDTHIDHFRPKGEVKQFETYNFNKPLEKSGYIWLKDIPTNYRACCIHANRITGEGGKGCYFPLKDGSPYLTKDGNELEIPLLLDPCESADVKILSFMGNNILCASDNNDDKEKVKLTKSIYNLDDPFIQTERAKVWEEIQKTLEEYNTGDINKNACLRRLRDAVNRNAPFSACAIACVNSLADDDIKSKLDLNL